jgi:hypothetical protein
MHVCGDANSLIRSAPSVQIAAIVYGRMWNALTLINDRTEPGFNSGYARRPWISRIAASASLGMGTFLPGEKMRTWCFSVLAKRTR